MLLDDFAMEAVGEKDAAEHFYPTQDRVGGVVVNRRESAQGGVRLLCEENL